MQADAEGVPARELADRYNRVIVGDLQGLGLSYDLFTRTSTRNHYAVVQELFRTVHRNGYFVPKTTMSAISPSTGRTLPDRYIEGTCPICGYDGARGDQCDNCGNQLDPIDLINPRSRINGETPIFTESEHYFLDLPALAGALGAWLQTRTDWRPNVLRFSLNLLDDLRPRAMTRDIDWGIPVPLDGWRDRPDKKLYVWFDAVIGYLSASIEWARRYGDHGQPDPDAWQRWWQGGDAAARAYYFMGKDNITFHSQIWPAELLAYNGLGRARRFGPGTLGALNLPTEVVSSEFLTMSGSKFSTSRKTVIYVGDFLREYGPDALRYFIAAAGPENQDADFTWEEFVRRTNFELANEWGNLVNRSISMAHKNFGEIPRPDRAPIWTTSCCRPPSSAFGTVGELLSRSRFKAASGEAMRVAGLANKYISESEPWKLGDDPERQAHRAAHRAAGGRRHEDPADAVPAAFLAAGLRGARRAGVWAAQPEIREVTDFDDDVEGVGVPEVRDYPVTHRRLRRRAGHLAPPGHRGRPATGQADPAVHQARPETRRDRPAVGPDRLSAAQPGRLIMQPSTRHADDTPQSALSPMISV